MVGIGKRIVWSVIGGAMVVLMGTITAASGTTVVQGRVRASSGKPVAGAGVKVVSSGLETTTDTAGFFTLGMDASGTFTGAVHGVTALDYRRDGLVIRGMAGSRASVMLFNMKGRRIARLFEGEVPSSHLVVEAAGRLPLADGFYLYRITVGERTLIRRANRIAGRLIWQNRSSWTTQGRRLAKPRAVGHLEVTHPGYDTATVPLESDTSLGLVVTLYPVGVSRPAPVSWTAHDTVLTTSYLCSSHERSSYTWLGSSIRAYNNRCVSGSWGSHAVRYTRIVVDNGLIRVLIAPELGLRVLAAWDISVPGEEPVPFFKGEGSTRLTNEWLKGDGGVEPSFPFYESGTSTVHQEGGYRIVENADGSVTVAMNMRMDHRQTEMDMGFLGKYGDRPLSGMVTVRPGSNMFELTYRADNHNPTRRSNRLWSNTFFPGGATSVLFPVYYAADHCLTDYWVVNGNPTNSHLSDFGLFPDYPFSGMWYADEEVNRVRVSDPETAPGMKLYDQLWQQYYEIWGSTNSIFEVPEGFVREYEPVELTQCHYVTRGIDRVEYADENVAIALPSSGRFEMIATRPATVTVRELEGAVLVDRAPIGPRTKVGAEFTDGIEVELDGERVFRGRLPLVLSRDTSGLGALQESSRLSWGDRGVHTTYELRREEGFQYARNIEMEELASKWWTLGAFAVAHLQVSEGQKASVPKEAILSAANTCYKLGRLDRAKIWARLVNFKGGMPEADYLLGLIAWEKGETVEWGTAGILANYHRALTALHEGDHTRAVELLRDYVDQYPESYRPRLALAYLTRDREAAIRLAMENPGSPEALAVLKELGYAPAAAALETLVDTQTGSDVALADFLAEIKEGRWRHGRRYEYVHPEFASSFPFPEYLKR
jgi:hypothetical protein